MRSTKTSVSCLKSSMVVECHGLGCMSAAGTIEFIEGTMDANMYCDIEAEHDPLPSETGPQGSIQI